MKLSPRRLQILKLVAKGKTNQEIADELSITIHTVRRTLDNVYKIANVCNRREIIVWALANNTISKLDLGKDFDRGE